MLTIDDAQHIVLESVAALPAEQMPLLQALGCTLAEPVVANVSLPPFDNSAMDGYAVIAEDTRGASAEKPCTLRVIEDLPAGTFPSRSIERGTAARIMTGAPVPAGADAVVMVEHTRPADAGAVAIFAPAQTGDNIRPMGEDIQRGQTALAPGRILGAGEISLAAALGHTDVTAVRRPRVAIVTTGSELVEPGRELPPGGIYNSNRVLLEARVISAGARVAESFHVADDEKAAEDALRRCATADIILTTGGVSVGEYDLVKNALQRLGEIKFWRVLMKPGKPVAFGTVLGRPLFGLPGNPVSALVTFETLVAPALRKLSGRQDCLPPTVEATVLSDLAHKPGRREYRQAFTRLTAEGFAASPSAKHGSAILTTMVGANSLIVIPETSTGVKAGEKVTVLYPAYR